jgi:exopolyphosphatase/pppGpp-phosphohydrolase
LSTPAIIDVGSNTIHLLVGEVDDGAVMPITGEKISARLGSGVDETGRIEDARIPIAAEAIMLFARLAALHGASEPAVLATSAVRDAENGPELIEEVRKRAGGSRGRVGTVYTRRRRKRSTEAGLPSARLQSYYRALSTTRPARVL